jgi:hypothetical protein
LKIRINLNTMGKLLIISGAFLIVTGVCVLYADKIPFFGKLPGDISIERENFKFYFPLASCILISLLISLVLFLINRFKN